MLGIPFFVSCPDQVMQVPAAFPQEPCFLYLSPMDSSGIPHPPLTKAPETGHDPLAESSAALI